MPNNSFASLPPNATGGESSTDEAFRRACERFEAFDYDEAARILEQVPPSCRNQNIDELQTRIAERREELATLDRELREAVREKRLFDLPPRIERVLALKPDHVYAKELAEQVWSRLSDAAETRLADYRHDEALQLLDRVAPVAAARDWNNCGGRRRSWRG